MAHSSDEVHNREASEPLITVLLSPYLCRVLRQPSASSLRRFLPEAFSTNSRPAFVGDKAYDSDPLDTKLKNGIELIAPHRRRRRTPDAAGCVGIENAGK
jgi:hypothetical protein